jgi:hypothetical protein
MMKMASCVGFEISSILENQEADRTLVQGDQVKSRGLQSTNNLEEGFEKIAIGQIYLFKFLNNAFAALSLLAI